MAESFKILFLSAEVAPFAKQGGLADVASSLPKALKELGQDVRIVMPAYRGVEQSLLENSYHLKVLIDQLEVETGSGLITAGVFEGTLPESDVPIYFIAERNLFDRDQIYGYGDDAYRFSYFSLAALELCRLLSWQPDLVHANDWHTAPAITWLDTAGKSDSFFERSAAIFTIHNLAHQGKTTWQILDFLRVWSHSLVEEGYGEVNFMARGIFHATLINTVSPTYAREILTPDGGAGLDGILRHRAYDVHGILNGLDYRTWNPGSDPNLAMTFDSDDLADRKLNKLALQARAGLPQREDVPLLAMVTRLDWQKGLDITGHVIHLLMNNHAGEAQFVILGSGAFQYEQTLAHLAGYHRDNMSAFLYYDPELAPLVYGGSDIFLMPSLFEPCGLGQMIAMHYGSIPVVRSTGGLADTVEDGIDGFTFFAFSAEAFWRAIERATWTYRVDPDIWRQMQKRGMEKNFSWAKSAQGYVQLYEWAIARKRH